MDVCIWSFHQRVRRFGGSVSQQWRLELPVAWLRTTEQFRLCRPGGNGTQIVPGEVEEELDFDLAEGIAGLRKLVLSSGTEE